jgi:hypothetical protein
MQIEFRPSHRNSAKQHKGFDHVIPSVVRGGRAVPFTDGSTALSKELGDFLVGLCWLP